MVPVWGTAAVLIAPPAPLLSTGYVAGNTLPAQYWNYIFFHITKELNNVLTAAGVAQSGATDTQLISSINLLAGNTLISTSGTLGTIALTYMNTMYVLTAASTATLPATAPLGARVTFKAKTTATTTITANAGQTIGTTTSTSFVLYAQEDYVTLEWDGTSIWYVVATNGPVVSSNQTAIANCTTLNSWTAIGNGFSLGTLQPGVYDLELDLSMGGYSNAVISIGIGNGTTLISVPNGGNATSSLTTQYFAMHVGVKNYVLSASAIIQGIYYSPSGGGIASYATPYNVGRITARRIG